MKQTRGFTLIELMIAVTILAIIVGIAYPSYTSHVAQSGRAEGVALLLDAANRQQQYYLDHHAYTSDMTKLGYSADPQFSETRLYSVDATAADVNGFTLVATAKGAQATRDTGCTSLSLNELGTRGSNGNATDTSGCWP